MNSAKCKVQSSKFQAFQSGCHISHSALRVEKAPSPSSPLEDEAPSPLILSLRGERTEGEGEPPSRGRGEGHIYLHSAGGFTYVALLVAIVIIGISLGAAGKYWSSVMQREREEELLFRGEQYRLAIERYYLAKVPNLLPPSIDALLSDDRFPQAKRHLRQKFKDPITGEDFELIKDKLLGNRISGVFSPSEKTPFKTTGFPEQLQSFEGKVLYSEWKFVYTPQQLGLPVRPPVRPPTGPQ